MRRLGLDQLDHLFRCMTLASDPLHQWTLLINDRWQEGHTAHASSEEALAQGANSVKSHVSECICFSEADAQAREVLDVYLELAQAVL